MFSGVILLCGVFLGFERLESIKFHGRNTFGRNFVVDRVFSSLSTRPWLLWLYTVELCSSTVLLRLLRYFRLPTSVIFDSVGHLRGVGRRYYSYCLVSFGLWT